MAKKKSRQDKLIKKLRAAGLRKKAARTLAAASEKADSKRLRKAVEDLRGVLGDLESRVSGAIGSEPEPPKAAHPRAAKAAKPAAKRAPATTSSAAAAKRSAAAKKAAATRAANRARAAQGGTAPARPAPSASPSPSSGSAEPPSA